MYMHLYSSDVAADVDAYSAADARILIESEKCANKELSIFYVRVHFCTFVCPCWYAKKIKQNFRKLIEKVRDILWAQTDENNCINS